jgi:cyclopropane fatty-acyl-phospholipid synthase-like methyltransferase
MALRKMTGVMLLVALAVAAARAQQPPQGKPDHMEHKFDPATSAKAFDDPARDAWQMPERVIKALGLAPTAAVADIGAGTGYFSVRLAKAVPSGTVYAVDVEAAMLDHIRTRATAEHLANITTVLAAPDSPKLPKPVNTILIVDTYHHIPSRVAYFRALQSSLLPGGRVAIVDFKKDSPEGPPPEFRFDPDRIIGEMRQAGFAVDAQHDFLPRQLFLVFKPSVSK